MSASTQHPCFGCKAPIPATPGNYYCGDCVATQTAAAAAQREAFDAYHDLADRIARSAPRRHSETLSGRIIWP